MKNIVLFTVLSAFTVPVAADHPSTGFLEGEAQEVIIKVRTQDGVKWYKVKPDGTRQELNLKPGDRFEFLYEDDVTLDAITVKPKKE